MKTLIEKRPNKNAIIAVVAVSIIFVSFLSAVKILSEKVESHFDNEIIVCIDAGHGGSSIGAVSNDSKRLEKDDNLNLALKTKTELEKLGAKVVMTRDDDTDVSLKDRCKKANKRRCDYFISIHRNSSENGTGFEAWISNTPSITETKIAKKLTKNLSEISKLSDRGVKKGYRDTTANNYYVNANTNMPSVLLEVSFISNDNDNRLFDRDIEAYAKSIAQTIFSEIS